MISLISQPLIKNYTYDQSVPYNYVDLSDDEATKVKARIEKESAEMAKTEIEKRELAKKRHDRGAMSSTIFCMVNSIVNDH